MKNIYAKITTLILSSLLLASCVSVKKYNSQINEFKSEKQLKADVDFVYEKLQKLHPHLYWYISKKVLDYKFDSLKSIINTPMTSNDFFFKLSPVIASIKQGHTMLSPLTKRLTKSESRALFNQGGHHYSILPMKHLTTSYIL